MVVDMMGVVVVVKEDKEEEEAADKISLVLSGSGLQFEQMVAHCTSTGSSCTTTSPELVEGLESCATEGRSHKCSSVMTTVS